MDPGSGGGNRLFEFHARFVGIFNIVWLLVHALYGW